MDAPKPNFVTVTGDIENSIEYYNIRDYYAKLFYTNNEELTIICYNMKDLDGIKYELKINLEQIYNISSIFRQYTSMKELYEFIIDLIKDGKYEVNKNEDNNLVLNFIITDIKKNEHKITFTLYHENNNNTQEYVNILTNEIKNMRIINNNNINEIKELKKENIDIKNEIKEIKKILSKYENTNNQKQNESKLKCSNNYNITLKGRNNKKNQLLKNINNDAIQKICSICKSNIHLKRCFCNKIFCNNCLLNNKDELCKKEYCLFNNNLNKLNSLYNISKYPLPKNFEAKIHFSEVNFVRIGITFDSNISNEKQDINSPNYKVYYLLQDMNTFFSYNENKWIKYFNGKNILKNEDDLTIILKNGELRYLLNGEDLGKSYIINNNDLDEEEMYLLIHRRNQYSQCELKYIYEIVN